MQLGVFMFLTALWVGNLASAKKPHILFIIADDLGWNDIGFHNPLILTPNIDKLAAAGVILNSSYVQPLCSPSRSAFLSGYYPFKSGLQHMVIGDTQAVCSPLNRTLLPQTLKQLGYATHMVGKWHLGFCNWNCTPTYRGFDSFLGYYNAMEDYYTHMTAAGYDYRDNKDVLWKENGTYSAYTFVQRAEKVIADHDATTPLFLYLPFQNVHEPVEVPKKYEDMYPHIQNVGRRTFSGMVSMLDEAIGNVTDALKKKGIYNDTLIAFTADNGGWVTYYGNNYPLRGGKFTIYEGGTKGNAFFTGAGVKKTGYTYDGLMHAVDWFPTIAGAAGGTPVPNIDGMNLWEEISTGKPSLRTEFIYNLDDMFPEAEGHAAIRMGDYKLIEGYGGLYDGWYKPATLPEDVPADFPGVENAFNNQVTPNKEYRLYNIKDDPTEHHDISKENPDIVTKLKTRMEYYHKQMVPANYPQPNPASYPEKWGGAWTPGWC